MEDFSILIGGKAGDGIDTTSVLIGRILNKLGFYIYIYRDYPSLIRGGHTFSIIRASTQKISTHSNQIDVLLALNQDCIDQHRDKLKDDAVIIFNSDLIKQETLPKNKKNISLSLEKITKEENAPAIMRNSGIVGAMCKLLGIKWEIIDSVFRKDISKELDLNLKVANKGYSAVQESFRLDIVSQRILPLLTGNEAIGFGLIQAGLKSYVSYPMTPSSGILHFLAAQSQDFSLKVMHPESEIAVILMALGFSSMGEKVAVGTSGGGFCLMTEGVSLCGIAELPLVIIVGQRTGPSTGLPTYTGQSELDFVLSAGHGEFPRLVVSPGDAEEAYYWSGISLNLAWKFQIPSFILSDKTLAEGTYSFDVDSVEKLAEEKPTPWDRKSSFKRYLNTETGVSALTFFSDKDAIVKINSYEHDEFGITTEDAKITNLMQEKRLRKEKYLKEELKKYDTVRVHGKKDAEIALLCWGSNKGVCVEAAQKLGIKVIQPIVLWPFCIDRFRETIKGVKKLICVENNATAQLANLIGRYGFGVNEKILKYDGRPFSLEELEEKIKSII